jgi:hypothetical protein
MRKAVRPACLEIPVLEIVRPTHVLGHSQIPLPSFCAGIAASTDMHPPHIAYPTG